MLSQDDHLYPYASSQTRQMSGVLTPGSDSSLNEVLDSGGKKRKRDGNTMEDLLKDTFVVRPYPSTVFVKPRSLQPLLLLPRSHLPLSCLDFVSSTNALSQSRLFETHIKILELEERMGSQPMVLIAKLDDGRTLYAVEREDRGLYVLCQLGSWVNLQKLKTAAVVSKQELSKTADKCFASNTTLQENRPVPLITPESSKYSKKKRLAIEAIQSMVKRPSTGIQEESQPAATDPEPLHDTQNNVPLSNIPVMDGIETQPTATELFENVRNQYFETLYLSKASLAYFAKGPLSRARAAFHLDYDSTLDMNDHIAFLESLIMSTTLIDKKYRDGLPGCISLIDIQDHSADDANQVTEKTKKRRSSKKMKPGKNGLYPVEDALIRRWWASHDDDAESGVPETSKAEILKSRVSQLRIRETQLQMIVVLEVLALQPLVSASEDIIESLPAALPTTEIMEGKGKAIKSKKPDHLTMLIDVHIDRLCIWQSIALEAVKAPVGDKSTKSSAASLSKPTDNILRDFCVEVIAPFFSARLPDRCATINRKLGGPIIVSPPKPRLSKSAIFSSAPSRPGAATKRPVPAKPRRSLQRVLTDDRERRSISRGPNTGRAISLMRSATMPVVPGLKREASEAPSLSSIPAADSLSLEANRGGMLNLKRFSRREVDLNSLAPEANSKAKKQANIEAELKDAISALKRPNRELAGKVLVETAEKRSTSASHSRKSKKPIRNPLFQAVQITATPKANRRKDVFSDSQNLCLPQMFQEEEKVILPSSLPRIPQSAARPSNEIAPNKNPLFASIQATPTRKSVPAFLQPERSLLGAGGLDQGPFPPSSPLHARRSGSQLFPVVPESTVKKVSNSSMSYGIQETPAKKRSDIMLDHSHPSAAGSSVDNKENVGIERGSVVNNALSKSTGMREEESIYHSLGWDDSDEIDDLA